MLLNFILECLVYLSPTDILKTNIGKIYLKNGRLFLNKDFPLSLKTLSKIERLLFIDKKLNIQTGNIFLIRAIQRFRPISYFMEKCENVREIYEPKIKEVPQSFLLFVENISRIQPVITKSLIEPMDFSVFTKIWKSPEYGPIIAVLTYLGEKEQKISHRALLYTFATFKREILMESGILMEKQKNPFALFHTITNKKYKYCYNSYNFLTDFYLFGKCNCACGTTLILLLSHLLNFPNVFTIRTETHQQIYYDGEIFETTNMDIGFINKKIDWNNYLFAIHSLEIEALHLLFQRNDRTFLKSLLNIRGNFLDWALEIPNMTEILNVSGASNISKFSLADINSLCLIGFALFGGNIRDALVLNREYLKKDLENLTKITDEIFLTRLKEFSKKCSQKLIRGTVLY